MAIANISFALFAGLFSILSPCVLPLVPVVLGTAAAEHKLAPAALAIGLALSFTAIGLFVATIGYTIGLDGEVFRIVGAIMLTAVGALLAIPKWQARVALVGGPLSNWAEQRFGETPRSGLRGQFGLGVLLGAVWSPCVGPTLGAASVLAAQGRDLGQVTLTMLMFGIGSALPLLLVGLFSREALMRSRKRLLATGQRGKIALGSLLFAGGLLILLGLDKSFEAGLLKIMPSWLLDLSGRF